MDIDDIGEDYFENHIAVMMVLVVMMVTMMIMIIIMVKMVKVAMNYDEVMSIYDRKVLFV